MGAESNVSGHCLRHFVNTGHREQRLENGDGLASHDICNSMYIDDFYGRSSCEVKSSHTTVRRDERRAFMSFRMALPDGGLG